jgi:hypothetical protein
LGSHHRSGVLRGRPRRAGRRQDHAPRHQLRRADDRGRPDRHPALQGRHQVVGIAEEYEAKCASGSRLTSASYLGASLRINTAGRFAGMHDGGVYQLGEGQTAEQLVTYQGRVSGRTLTGAIDVAITVKDATGAQVDTCSVKATFKTAATKGKVYAGLTSQRAPVVIELSASGGAVHHLHIGWRSTCKPQGGFQFGDTLTGFARVRGVFGDDFTQSFGEPSQEHETDAYSVHGRLTKLKATGTFRVKTQEIAGTGAIEADCDSGAITFTAATG